MAQSRTRSRVTTHAIIKAIGVATAAGMVIMAPNTVVALDKLLQGKDAARNKRALADLKYRRLVETRLVNGACEYRLTKYGVDRFFKIQLDDLTIPMPRRWDHKWRVVAFDIPAPLRSKRRPLLTYLKQLGFYKLQDSLWVHPFECEREVGIVLTVCGLDKHVTYMTVTDGNFADHATAHFRRARLLM